MPYGPYIPVSSGSGLPPQTGQQIGINVGQPGFSGWARPSNDAGIFQSPFVNTASPAGVIDPATGDAVSGTVQRTMWTREPDVFAAGVYDLTWNGAGTINGNSSPTTITVASAQQSININSVGAVEDLTIIPQGATGQFTSSALTRLGGFKCLRTMEALRTNEDAASGEGEYDPAIGYKIRKRIVTNTFYHRVVPIRFWADLCYELNSNIWITFHHLATTANIQAMVQEVIDSDLIADGRTLYVEHSNEVWNANFPQFNYALTQANATIPAYGGGDTHNRMAWHADRTNEIGGIVKAMVPGAVVVLGSQNAVPAFGTTDTPTLGLALANSNLANIDAIAVAPYFGQAWVNATANATIQGMTNAQIVQEARNDWELSIRNLVLQWKTNTDDLNMDLLTYEGGAHLFDSDPTTQAKLVTAAQSTEMGTLYDEVLQWWDDNIGNDQLTTLFQDVGSPEDPWSMVHGELGSNSPRMTTTKARL